MSPAVISLAVTLVVLAAVVGVVALTGGGPLRTGRRPLPIPVPWLVAGIAVVLVGVVVMPRLLGFMFLLLPMIWSRAARRPGGPGGPGRGGSRGPGSEPERDPFDEDR